MVQLFAHRGSHRAHPENTLAAFRAAIEEGADGVELDVRTCQSGEVVVCHDPHLGRLARRALWVGFERWATLREVELLGGGQLPLLDTVLDLVLGAGLEVNVEVKGDVPDRVQTSVAVAHLLARRSAEARGAIHLSTFDPVVLRALRRHARDVRTGLLFDRDHTGLFRAALLVRGLRPDGVHPHHSLCTPERVRAWHRRGLYVDAWTIDEPSAARALRDAGVDALITDDVPALRTALDLA